MKPRSYTDQFYQKPSPEGAVALAIADHKAFTKQRPQWEYVAQLQEAERRCKAYRQLVTMLHAARHDLYDALGGGDDEENRERAEACCKPIDDLLTELGEAA